MVEFIETDYSLLEQEAVHKLLQSYLISDEFDLNHYKIDANNRNSFLLQGIEGRTIDNIKLISKTFNEPLLLEDLMINTNQKSWIYLKLSDVNNVYVMNLHIPTTKNKNFNDILKNKDTFINSLVFENNCLYINFNEDKQFKYDGNSEKFSYNF